MIKEGLVYQFGKFKFQYVFVEDDDSDDDEDPFYINPEFMFQQMRFVEYEYECFDRLNLTNLTTYIDHAIM